MSWSRHVRKKKLAQSCDQETSKVYFTMQTVIWTASGQLSIDLNICFMWDVRQCCFVCITHLCKAP